MLQILQNIDAGMLLWIQEHLRITLLNPLFWGYTQLGNMGILWIAVSIFLLFFPKTRRAGVASLLALLVGVLVTNGLIKPLASRPRPYVTIEALQPLLLSVDPNSFPSGHTCAAFAAAGAWCRTLPRRWMKVLSVVLAVLMGYSRVYVGIHYPFDVLAGCIIGLCSAYLGCYILTQAERRRKGRTG